MLLINLSFPNGAMLPIKLIIVNKIVNYEPIWLIIFYTTQKACLSSPDVKNALNNKYKYIVVVWIDKATGNITITCQKCYILVIAKKLGLYNNSQVS